MLDNYEKNVDKALNAVDKVGKAASRVQIGCITLLVNVFFAGFCLWGVYTGYVSWRLEQGGEKTTGNVVRLDERNSSEDGCCVYSPVIEFVAGGQTYSFESGNASDPPAYDIGQEVLVLYDPASPETAQINSFFERWVFPIIIIPAMIFAALIVNFFMIRSWRRGEHIEV